MPPGTPQHLNGVAGATAGAVPIGRGSRRVERAARCPALRPEEREPADLHEMLAEYLVA